MLKYTKNNRTIITPYAHDLKKFIKNIEKFPENTKIEYINDKYWTTIDGILIKSETIELIFDAVETYRKLNERYRFPTKPKEITAYVMGGVVTFSTRVDDITLEIETSVGYDTIYISTINGCIIEEKELKNLSEAVEIARKMGINRIKLSYNYTEYGTGAKKFVVHGGIEKYITVGYGDTRIHPCEFNDGVYMVKNFDYLKV